MTALRGGAVAESQPSPWLTIKEARLIAKCGVKLLYREIAAGRLRAARIGNRRDLRVHRDWLDQWLVRSSEPIEIARRVS